MNRTSAEIFHPMTLPLDESRGDTLVDQISEGIRAAVLDGRLVPGQRLPSSRALAEDLGVARGTVVDAYEQLVLEGYLRSVPGSGTYVDRIPEHFLHTDGDPRAKPPDRDLPHIARRASDPPASLIDSFQARRPRPFQPGLPPLDEFPRQILARIWNQVIRSVSFDDLAYGDSGGYPPLRGAIASYLGTARAVKCRPEQVIITNGAQQALHLAARVLLDAGESVWIENPGYRGARSAFTLAELHVVPVPVDAEGLSVAAGRERAPQARLAYVTPSHQYPTGVVMSISRRLELIEWARSTGGWILEDDYDSEYQYEVGPLPSLHHLDAGGQVIYCGSFSKTLAPGLRVGYLVVPEVLIDAFCRIRSALDHHTAAPVQAALARFMEDGHFGRHLRRQRRLGLVRRDALLEAFRSQLPSLELEGTSGGLHALVRLPDAFDDARMAAGATGLSLSPLSRYDLTAPPQRGFVLGYAAYTEAQIREGVKQLARLLR